MNKLNEDWMLEPRPTDLTLEDYEGLTPRWCSGCGDTAVLSSVQRICRDEQLAAEKIVVVSGIGCSSRFPHYMKTYGFHGLHGRAFPVACGVRSRRPDLHIFVATGDGDCCAIGTAHWIHAVRYNMNMTVMLFDNNIYGLTKKQSSPTTPRESHSFTHPDGNALDPIKPLLVTLSISNVSFVAQTVDWNPIHLYNTLLAAHRHQGFSFVRILQRCPHFTPYAYDKCQRDPDLITLLEHPDGIETGQPLKRIFKNRVEHDPGDLGTAMALASRDDLHPIGLFYRNPQAIRYDQITREGIEMTVEEKRRALKEELAKCQI